MAFTPLTDAYHVARKQHRCEWCGQIIPIGERYFRYSGICDGDFQDTCMHTECKDAMDRDLAEGLAYGNVDYYLPDDASRGLTASEWEDIRTAEQPAPPGERRGL